MREGVFNDLTGTTADTSTAVTNARNAEIVPSIQTPSVLQGKATALKSPAQTLARPQKQFSYVEMLNRLSPYAPPTPEELQAMKDRERRSRTFSAIGDAFSAMSNLYFTSQGAPNAYNPQTSASKKVGDIWDKYNKEREDKSQRYLAMYMQARQMDDAKDRDDRNWKAQLERQAKEDEKWNMQFNWQKEKEKERMDYQKAKDKEDREWKQKQFDEGVRQFNANNELARKNASLTAARLQREIDKDYNTFILGEGKGTIRINKDRLNSQTVSYIFNTLTPEQKASVQGSPVYGTNELGQKTIIGYDSPTAEQMLLTIGTYVGENDATQRAIREVAGQKMGGPSKKANPMSDPSSGKKQNPMG